MRKFQNSKKCFFVYQLLEFISRYESVMLQSTGMVRLSSATNLWFTCRFFATQETYIIILAQKTFCTMLISYREALHTSYSKDLLEASMRILFMFIPSKLCSHFARQVKSKCKQLLKVQAGQGIIDKRNHCISASRHLYLQFKVQYVQSKDNRHQNSTGWCHQEPALFY